jgi:adenylosuccinate lyase
MIRKNLERFGAFSGTEVLLMKLAKEGGADRQAMHERIRVHSFKAWEEVMRGNPNPLSRLLADDPALTVGGKRVTVAAMDRMLDPTSHVGTAGRDATRLVKGTVRPLLRKYKSLVGRGTTKKKKVRY